MIHYSHFLALNKVRRITKYLIDILIILLVGVPLAILFFGKWPVSNSGDRKSEIKIISRFETPYIFSRFKDSNATLINSDTGSKSYKLLYGPIQLNDYALNDTFFFKEKNINIVLQLLNSPENEIEYSKKIINTPSISNPSQNKRWIFLGLFAALILAIVKLFFKLKKIKRKEIIVNNEGQSPDISQKVTEIKPEELLIIDVPLIDTVNQDNPPVESNEFRDFHPDKLEFELNKILRGIMEERDGMSAAIENMAIESPGLKKSLNQLIVKFKEKDQFYEDFLELETGIIRIDEKKPLPESPKNNRNATYQRLVSISKKYDLGLQYEKLCNELSISPVNAKSDIENKFEEKYSPKRKEIKKRDEQLQAIKKVVEQLEKDKQTAKNNNEELRNKIKIEENNFRKLSTEVENSKRELEEKNNIEHNLYQVVWNANAKMQKSNSNPADYRQYVLPKLIEVFFYCLDYLEWTQNKSFNQENLEMLKKVTDGELQPIRSDKVIREYNANENREYLNNFWMLLNGLDVGNNILRSAKSPRVLIGGYKIETTAHS